jgi:hypothetical protein
MLGELACMVTIGHEPPTTSWKDNEEELSKRLLSEALRGSECIFFDNIKRKDYLGGGALEMAVTASAISDRVLGASEMAEAPLEVTWIASGNNLQVSEDMRRRTLWCRLDADRPDPENRTGFKYSDVKAHVCAHHAEYLSAALTLVRAYMFAGKPDVGARKMGSFVSWCELISSAVMWVGLPDPATTQDRQKREAPDDLNAAYIAIASSVLRLQTGRDSNGLTGQTAKFEGVYLRDLTAADEYNRYAEAVEACVAGRGPHGTLTFQQVGEILKGMRGVSIDLDGQVVKLVGRTDRKGATRWLLLTSAGEPAMAA